MEYEKPKCDKCGKALIITESAHSFAKMKIDEFGFANRRTYEFKTKECWLTCVKCRLEWEMGRDSVYRVTKGAAIRV
jgi:hypothetical protein